MPATQRRGAIAAGGGTPFNPLSITGCQLWFDANDASSFTFGTGTQVSQWNDKSTNNRHCSQATGANQPTRNGSQNGRTTVVYNGTSQVLFTASFFLAQPTTQFAVVKNTDASANNRQIIASSNSSLDMWISDFGSPGKWALYSGTKLEGSLADTAWHDFVGVFNGASSLIYLDGTQVGSGSANTSNLNGTVAVGAYSAPSNYWKGEIAEILWYNTVLSTGNRQAVEAYLKAKWGTP